MSCKRDNRSLIKKIAILFFCLFLASCAIRQIETNHDMPISEMEVIIFGLGRADSILITTENHAMMIDTGENQHGEDIVNFLHRQNITSLDYLIITHFDRDHVGGAYHIIDAIDVQTVILPNYSRESRHVSNMNQAMDDANLEPVILIEPRQFALDDAHFIIDPSQLPYFAFGSSSDDDDSQDDTEEAPSANNFSIVVSIVHGENSFLFTGDAQSRRMREILRNAEMMVLDFDFLKVPRHGRYMRRSREFMEAIRPRYAVITDSYEREADEELLAILEELDVTTFFARRNGVHVISNGTELIIEYKDFFASE